MQQKVRKHVRLYINTVKKFMNSVFITAIKEKMRARKYAKRTIESYIY